MLKPKVFPRSSIFTPGERRRIARRLDRRIAGLDAALTVMRWGEFLHLKYRSDGRPCWSLSNGHPVTVEVANILINDASISPADGALFPCVPAQTWKLGGSK